MNLDPELQEIYYDDYWNPVERNTDYKVSDYIRFYLSTMEAKTPAIKKVYPAFRTYTTCLLYTSYRAARRRYAALEQRSLREE